MTTLTMDAPRLALTDREAAAILGVSPSWLQHDRAGARLIPFYRIGRSIRYNPERIRAALAQLEEGGSAALRKGGR